MTGSKLTHLKYSERDLSLDSLRGLILIIITVNHLKGVFYKYTWETFGFISGAEGFIFISGLVFGIVYGKRLIRNSFKFVYINAAKRAAVIYAYHILIFISVLYFLYNHPYYSSDMESLRLGLFFEDPVKAVFFTFILLNQPEFLDILPLYVVFVLTGPLMLIGFKNNKASYVLGISITIWLATQFTNKSLLPEHWNVETGYFNVFSWQLLFTIGCFLGYTRAAGKKVLHYNYYLLVMVILILAFLFLARHPLGLKCSCFELIRPFTERSTLGPVRLLNFLLFAYLIDFFIKKGVKFEYRALSILGQHSLQVFAFSLIALYYISPVKHVFIQSNTIVSVLFEIAIVTVLYIPAYLHIYARQRFKWFARLGL